MVSVRISSHKIGIHEEGGSLRYSNGSRSRLSSNVDHQGGKKQNNLSSSSSEKEKRDEDIENIINESRLLELQMAVDRIKDENYIIIQGQFRNKLQTIRGSRYRGVSKNGNKWQVLVMGNQKKQYSGSIRDETAAARMYDRFAIKNLGLRAKTNFDYKRQDLIRIIRKLQESDEDSGNGSAGDDDGNSHHTSAFEASMILRGNKIFAENTP